MRVPGRHPVRIFAMACMVASSVVISFGGVIVRSIDHADPLQINFYRSVGLVFAVMLFLALRYRREVIPSVLGIGRMGLVGGGLLAGAGITFLQALHHTTVANTLFILGAIPFFAALMARIALGEVIAPATWMTMAIAGLGLGVMVMEGVELGVGYGNVMAISTALFFASYAEIISSIRDSA